MREAGYTTADLLSEPGLGLELVVGSDAALQRPLLGAHSIELENPAKWLERGWMMLTMGVRVRNKPALQRQLINELHQLGASCLGFGVGLAFKSLPPALLEEAERLDFPVIRIPEETQFREVTRAVFESTAGIDSTTFKRLSSIQQNLVRAFGDDNPLESIVRRLGRLVNAVVAVISIDGEVIVTTGAFPVAEVLEDLRNDPAVLIRQLAVDGWKVLASPINDIRGPGGRWLVIASQRSSVTDQLTRAAMQVTLPLLDAQMRMSITTRDQDRAIRKSLLDAMLDEPGDHLDRKMLGTRVAALGLRFDEGLTLDVIRLSQSQRAQADLEEIAAALSARLEQVSTQHLLSVRNREVVILSAPDGKLELLMKELVASNEDLRVGVGRPVSSPEDARTSWRDAQLAVQHLALHRSSGILVFEELDLITQILAEVPADRVGSRLANMADELRKQPIQLEALRAYFSYDRDIRAAAAAIYLHPNTLRYRLERFEASFGRSLQEPSTIASIYCLLTLMSDEDV